ncbi:hypothetical protein [Jidongwangia harbinensis]|uniref:hypothetical protein n=1 Tax=Jidongwangia harbinensis TaxID=2878561 RepID=UPI001CD934A7|nr:hypothetical protein [Jidongwangia harbinensis]MCA2219080.1 hypothetical protein [Jidongwangia harbinensis]
MSSRARLSRFAIVITGLAVLLAGCSGGNSETPPVATLQSQPPPVTASPQSAGQRPVFAFDATPDDKKAMTKPWEDCMVQNAGPAYRNSGQHLIEKGGIAAEDPKGRAALKVCLPKQPEAFDEHQRRTNLAEYRDNQRQWYQCAKAAGYQLTPADPETGQFGLTEVGPNGDAGSPAFQECRREAFTG